MLAAGARAPSVAISRSRGLLRPSASSALPSLPHRRALRRPLNPCRATSDEQPGVCAVSRSERRSGSGWRWWRAHHTLLSLCLAPSPLSHNIHNTPPYAGASEQQPSTSSSSSVPAPLPDLQVEFDDLADEPTAVQKFLFPDKEELPDDFEVRAALRLDGTGLATVCEEGLSRSGRGCFGGRCARMCSEKLSMGHACRSSMRAIACKRSAAGGMHATSPGFAYRLHLIPSLCPNQPACARSCRSGTTLRS